MESKSAEKMLINNLNVTLVFILSLGGIVNIWNNMITFTFGWSLCKSVSLGETGETGETKAMLNVCEQRHAYCSVKIM